MCPRWPGMCICGRPPPVPLGDGLAVPVVPLAAVGTCAVCWLTLYVAPVATLPFVVSVTGLVSPKSWQFRLVNEAFSLDARKLARLFPWAGTGDAVFAWVPASSLSLDVWMLTMSWQ